MIQLNTQATPWTALDLVERFGAIPLHRVIYDPTPGTATVEDVVRLDNQEDRLCELIDGTLVKKTVGYYESCLAVKLNGLLNDFVLNAKLGMVAGEGGMMELLPNQVRIPGGSFLSWESLKDSGFPDNPVPEMAPDLAVEIISKSNTPKEMERKLSEYFEAGTRLVWYVYPKEKTVDVFTSADAKQTLGDCDVLTGGNVLPGLEIELTSLFAIPKPE